MTTALPVRLTPGMDLRAELAALPARHGVRAAFVLAGIGSLDPACLRLAGAEDIVRLDGDHEILSLAGTLSLDGAHLHMSVADATGRVSGGHVAAGCRVRTTAEVLLQLLPDYEFRRELDASTSYRELRVRRLE